MSASGSGRSGSTSTWPRSSTDTCLLGYQAAGSTSCQPQCKRRCGRCFFFAVRRRRRDSEARRARARLWARSRCLSVVVVVAAGARWDRVSPGWRHVRSQQGLAEHRRRRVRRDALRRKRPALRRQVGQPVPALRRGVQHFHGPKTALVLPIDTAHLSTKGSSETLSWRQQKRGGRRRTTNSEQATAAVAWSARGVGIDRSVLHELSFGS